MGETGTLQERAAQDGHVITVQSKGRRGTGFRTRVPYRIECSCGWWTNTNGKVDATRAANVHARNVINETPDVRPGDVWADCDPRMSGRTMRVERVDELNVYGESRRKKVRIARKRMRPTSNGWRLVSRTPESRGEGE